MADMMKTKYGIPWIKANFIGAEATGKTLRKIADYFEDAELKSRVEEVIAEEMVAVKAAQALHRPRCEGKTAMLFVGGSRAHHYQELFSELGMRSISAGYEFAHRDDYEGRKVLPSIKVDADTRNIEEIEVEPDPERYRDRLEGGKLERLKEKGMRFGDYEGMMPEMPDKILVIDDLNHHETEVLMEKYKPDVFCRRQGEIRHPEAGIPLKQLHSYDYSGPTPATSAPSTSTRR
jgi:nitrogenase molybdenum-iron protein alpha chain